MDIRAIDGEPTAAERAAVDALLGPPASSWDGGTRGSTRDAHTAEFGGHDSRALRHQLLPSLQALQARVGWISEGGLGYVCTRLNVPPADAWGVATFYALLATSPRPKRVVHVCDDIACKCRGADALIAALEKEVGPAHGHAPHGHQLSIGDGDTVWMRSPCLGMCEQAPAALTQIAGEYPKEESRGSVTAPNLLQFLGRESAESAPSPKSANERAASQSQAANQSKAATTPRLLKRILDADCTTEADYAKQGGWSALKKAIAMGGDAVIAEVTASKLMGRGGAAFPTGRKWDAVAKQAAEPHYIICNADESEPGTFKDRVLMERDPFAIVEAMVIGAFATHCTKGFIYIRGEYPLAAARLLHAIDESRARGYLGSNILGSGLEFDIEIRRGGGAYICGEETAIFESIEGKRGEPRNKPPFPVQHGLFGKPTLVNNVETLANIPPIVLDGGAAFAAIGTPQSTGTRLFCLSGCVQRPGVYEVEYGTSLRALIELAGGLGKGRTLQSVLLGGAAGTFLRPDEIDLKLTHEDTRTANTTLGSGVVMVFDDTVDVKTIVERIAAFFRDESCGQCVPCRVGTVRQEEALHRLRTANGKRQTAKELPLLEEIGVAMRDGSICGLGQTAYAAVESAIKRLNLYGPTPDTRHPTPDTRA